MSGALAIVVFFSGLLLIILLHEGGHYLVARAFGFKVEEYFVGFGPKIWSFKRKGIEYGVKALPLGGYVKIAGMNPEELTGEGSTPVGSRSGQASASCMGRRMSATAISARMLPSLNSAMA